MPGTTGTPYHAIPGTSSSPTRPLTPSHAVPSLPSSSISESNFVPSMSDSTPQLPPICSRELSRSARREPEAALQAAQSAGQAQRLHDGYGITSLLFLSFIFLSTARLSATARPGLTLFSLHSSRIVQSRDPRDDGGEGIRHGTIQPQQSAGEHRMQRSGDRQQRRNTSHRFRLEKTLSIDSPTILLILLLSLSQVHHILYLFAELGDRATTETSVRKVMERGYGTDFYAGESLV